MADKDVRFGKYRIVRELASGSSGKTYLALTPSGKKVILKVVHSHIANNPMARRRIEREAAILKQLNHPQIARLIDSGEEDGVPYLVLQFVDGPTLRDYIRENAPLSETEALKIFRQLAVALSYLHQQGIIHRDIKPENIILSRNRPILIDFGLAKKFNLPSITVDGSIVGTMYYLPPEVLKGGEYSEKGDVYALGLILYEMLSGRLPFETTSFGELVEEKLNREIDCPPNVSDRTCRLIKILLDRDPTKRPSVTELLTEWSYSTERRRAGWFYALAVLVVLIAAVFAAIRFSSGRQPVPENREAGVRSAMTDTISAMPVDTVRRAAYGELHISVSKRSEVKIDGRKLGFIRDTVIDVDTGTVELEFFNPTYGRMVKKVRVSEGVTSVKLDWDAESGRLSIKVRPWGEIYVDGRKVGVSPLDRPIKVVGRHVVRVRHPVFGSVVDTVYVPPGRTVERTYLLGR